MSKKSFYKIIFFILGIILLNSLFACRSKVVSLKFSDNIYVNFNNRQLEANKNHHIPINSKLQISANTEKIAQDKYITDYNFRHNNKDHLIKYEDGQYTYTITSNTEISLILALKTNYLDFSLVLAKAEPYYKKDSEKLLTFELENFFSKNDFDNIIPSKPIIGVEKIIYNLKIKKDVEKITLTNPVGYLFNEFSLETRNILSNTDQLTSYNKQSKDNDHFINDEGNITISLNAIMNLYTKVNNFFYLKIHLNELSLSRYVYQLKLAIDKEISNEFELYDIKNKKVLSQINFNGNNNIPKETSEISLRLKDTSKYISKYSLDNVLKTYDYTAYSIDLTMNKDYTIKLNKDSLIENTEPLKKLNDDFIIVDKKTDQEKYYLTLILKNPTLVNDFKIFHKNPENSNLDDDFIYRQGKTSDNVYTLELNKRTPITKIEVTGKTLIAPDKFITTKIKSNDKFTINDNEVLYQYIYDDNDYSYLGKKTDNEYKFSEENIYYYRKLTKTSDGYLITPLRLVVDLFFLKTNEFAPNEHDPFLNFDHYHLGLNNDITLYKSYLIKDNNQLNIPSLFYKKNNKYYLKPQYELSITNNQSHINYAINDSNKFRIEGISSNTIVNVRLIYKGLLNDKNEELINRKYLLTEGLNIYNEEEFISKVLNNEGTFIIHNNLNLTVNNEVLFRNKLTLFGNYNAMTINGKDLLEIYHVLVDQELTNINFNINAPKLKSLFYLDKAKLTINNVMVNNISKLITGEGINLELNYLKTIKVSQVINLMHANNANYKITNSQFNDISTNAIVLKGTTKFNLTMLNNEFSLIEVSDHELTKLDNLLVNKKLLKLIANKQYLNYLVKFEYLNNSNLLVNLTIDNETFDYSQNFPGLKNFLNSQGTLNNKFYLFNALYDYQFTSLNYLTEYPKYLSQITSNYNLLIDYLANTAYLIKLFNN